MDRQDGPYTQLFSARSERARIGKDNYSTAEVAKRLACSPATVRRMANERRIPHIRNGRTYWFPIRAYHAWLEREAWANVAGGHGER